MSQTRQKYVLYKIWPASDAQNWRVCQFYRKNIRKTYSFFYSSYTYAYTVFKHSYIHSAITIRFKWRFKLTHLRSILFNVNFNRRNFFQARYIFIIRFHLLCVINTFLDFHFMLENCQFTTGYIYIRRYRRNHIGITHKAALFGYWLNSNCATNNQMTQSNVRPPINYRL